LAPISKNPMIEHVMLILHDLMIPETVIIQDRLERVFCLTDWHKKHFQEIFPSLSSIVETFSYGMDLEKCKMVEIHKQPYSFIYSSYPERGLLIILKMWLRILKEYPLATLHIFCDMENDYSNRVHSDQMKEIKRLLETNMFGIYQHGWVDKSTLLHYWNQSEYWFYPCIFQETFCLTALEAAVSKTLVITNGLAALQETASEDRTVCILGDASTEEWQERALKQLLTIMRSDQKSERDRLVEKNYEWVQNLSWESRANDFVQYLPKDIIETRGIMDWRKGWPNENEKVVYEQVLKKISGQDHLEILFIGNESGVSLYSTLDFLKDEKSIHVTTIDTWENRIVNGRVWKVNEWRIKESFCRNILNHLPRNTYIESEKGDFSKLLQEKTIKYDFIMIGELSEGIDGYVELLLAWYKLKSGVILGLDHYEREERVKNMVDVFLLKISKDGNIIHKGYRLFLEKNV